MPKCVVMRITSNTFTPSDHSVFTPVPNYNKAKLYFVKKVETACMNILDKRYVIQIFNS